MTPLHYLALALLIAAAVGLAWSARGAARLGNRVESIILGGAAGAVVGLTVALVVTA